MNNEVKGLKILLGYKPWQHTITDRSFSEIFEPQANSNLTALPSELHLKIFDELDDDPATAALLGITCKAFYPIYRPCHQQVLLRPKIIHSTGPWGDNLEETYRRNNQCLLYTLLSNWMPAGYDFETSSYSARFTPRERYLVLREEIHARFRASELRDAREARLKEAERCGRRKVYKSYINLRG